MNKDIIYREDAINELMDYVSKWFAYDPYNKIVAGIFQDVELTIKGIPSANIIEPKRGEWLKFGLGRGTRILFCTNCERRIEVPLSQGDSNYNFCPNCGARMKGVDDEVLRQL